MDLVAGPQGSGKSTFFPVADRGGDSFNADDRRRQLNRGSSRKIPPHVRRQVVAEYEAFINEHNGGPARAMSANVSHFIAPHLVGRTPR